jgi:hypothetical protein
VLYRMVAGFVGLHLLEDIGLLALGKYAGPHLPPWIFFPLGIAVSAVLFSILAKRIMKDRH